MSLRVWLPLNGNLNNQGTSGVTVTNSNATVDSTGKIGSCYRFNKNAYLSIPGSAVTSFSTECSVSLWLKLNSFNAAYDTYFQIGIDTTPWTSYRMGLLRSNSASTLTFVISDGSTSTQNSFTTPAMSTGVWTHLTLVYKTGHCLIYVNGALHADNATTVVPKFSDVTKIMIGGLSGSYKSDSYINDFRIYDHALSPKEVKEISKGLVLHYPLDGNGRGQSNLSNFSTVVSNWANDGFSSVTNYADSQYGSVIKIVASAADKRIYHNVSNVWTTSQVYTVSFMARATTSGITCDMSRSLADFTSTFTLTTDWKYYSGQINCTATPSGGTLSFRIRNATAEVYITNIKLELGSIATPYVPGEDDPNYTTLGYNSNIEVDTSGYKNNGTRNGTLTVDVNTAKYNTCTNFANNSYISTTITPTGYANTYTFSWFAKYSNYTNVMFWGFSNGNRLNLYSSTGGYFYWNTGDGANNPFGAASQAYADSNWHHFAITGDGTSVKLYIDGVLKGTATTFKAITGTNLILNGWDTGTSYKFNGYLSDFRLYATALSADDIKELYQSSASITNNGSIMCYDFIEQ